MGDVHLDEGGEKLKKNFQTDSTSTFVTGVDAGGNVNRTKIEFLEEDV